MRRNVKNDKVLHAITIGIAAMLAMSQPITVLAAEGDTAPATTGDDNNITEAQAEAGICDEAEAAAEAAVEEIEEAKTSDAIIKNDVKENVVAGEAGSMINEDGREQDLAQDVRDAAGADELTGGDDPLTGAATDVENAEIQLGIAENQDALSDAALNTAEDLAQDAEDISDEANEILENTQEQMDDKLDEISNAETVEEANAAYDELTRMANQAQEDFDAKLAQYNTAKENYQQAVNKVQECEEAYQNALNSAESNANEAAAKLEDAKTNAQTLEDAVNAAKDAVDESVRNAMDIAGWEDTTRTDEGLNWQNEDGLFISIMKNYYLPTEYNINDATVTRVRGIDNNHYNYFVVEYQGEDENGNPKTETMYFNYKMDGTSKDNIVIFEKREVEIFGNAETPDDYLNENGDSVSVSDVTAGLEDGSIVEAVDEDGATKKVVTNEKTDSEELVTNSEITGTSQTDVTIDEESKNESWALTESGDLVKTVTADVTTVTYTEKTFESTTDYATDADRDAAALAKKTELEEATGKDAEIVEKAGESTYTYTAEGTYIPTFTKTVNVKNEEVEWKHTNKLNDLGVKTEAEAVAQVKKDQEKDLKNSIKNDDDLYFIGVTSNLSVTGHTADKWYDDSDFLVSGTVSATYAKVTKKTVNQSTFGAIWDDLKSLFGGQSTNEKLEAAARKAIEAEGGIFVSANWDDWSFNKATIRYVAGVKVTTAEKDDKEEAKDAVNAAALDQAKRNGATGVMNVKTTGVNDIEHETYSFDVNYLEQTSSSTANKTIATETYGNADVLTGRIKQNLNYLNNNILLDQNNEAYRNFVDQARNLTDKYERLLDEAQAANAAVADAQTEVLRLQEQITRLSNNRADNLEALEVLEGQLAQAELNWESANDTLDEILDQLETAGTELDEVVRQLTPAEPEGPTTPETPAEPEGPATPEIPAEPEGPTTPETPAEPEGPTTPEIPAEPEGPATPEIPAEPEVPTTPEIPAEPEVPVTPETPAEPVAPTTPATPDAPAATETPVVVTTPVTAAVAPAANVNVITPAGVVDIEDEATPLADAEVVDIEDEDTPLADAIEDNDQEDNTVVADGAELNDADDEETMMIEDEETPLADIIVEGEKKNIPWWWLLIIALLGATGYEMYKKHNEKKQKAQTVGSDDAE